MTRPSIVTTGTSFKDWLQCARKRWWGHEAISQEPHTHWQDGEPHPVLERRGWERVRMAIPLSTGGWCHRVAQGLLGRHLPGFDMSAWYAAVGLEDDPHSSDASWVISAARNGYLVEVALRGLDAEGTPLDETRVAQEQAALLEAFGWAFERVRIPALLEQYEIVSIEREEFTLLAGDVGLAGRCDAVLRRRADGLLFVWNLKTVSQPDSRWSAQFEVDQQMMLEALAVERRLGERVYGALVEGFIKGPRVEADDDLKEIRQGSGKEATQRIQRSRLLYGYKLDANPPIQKADYDWEGTTRKGWHKFRVWEEQFPPVPCTLVGLSVFGGPVPVGEYSGFSPIAYWVNWLPEEVIQSQFVLLEPIIRSERAVESKLRQVVHAEREMRINRVATEASQNMNEDGALDRYWPQNEHSCTYPSRCAFYDMCWSSGVADDPQGSGLYQPRTPNHPEGDD